MKIDGITFRRNIFGELTAAMEAGPEDITATTDDMMKRASGARADRGQLNPPRTSEETQQENGDNLARGSMNENMDKIDPDNTVDPNTGMEDIGDLDGSSGNPDGGDMGMDDGMGGGDMGGDMGGGMEPQQNPEEKLRLTKLQRNMSHFYSIANSTYETLSTYAMPAANEDMRKLFNNIMNHMAATRDLMLDMLTSETTNENYIEKLRKYVALRHVYATVLDMLNLHFDMLDSEMAKKKPEEVGKS